MENKFCDVEGQEERRKSQRKENESERMILTGPLITTRRSTFWSEGSEGEEEDNDVTLSPFNKGSFSPAFISSSSW